jgi:hypothetical protein
MSIYQPLLIEPSTNESPEELLENIYEKAQQVTTRIEDLLETSHGYSNLELKTLISIDTQLQLSLLELIRYCQLNLSEN